MSSQARVETSQSISKKDLVKNLVSGALNPAEWPVIRQARESFREMNTENPSRRRMLRSSVALIALAAVDSKAALDNASSILIAPAVHAEPDWIYFQGEVWSSPQWGPHSARNETGITPLHASGGALEKLDKVTGLLRGQPGFSQHSAAKIANNSLAARPDIASVLGHCRELAVVGLTKSRANGPRNIRGIDFSQEDLDGILLASMIGEPYYTYSHDPVWTAQRLAELPQKRGKVKMIIESPNMWFRAVAAVSPDGSRVLAENFGSRKPIEREAIVSTQYVRNPVEMNTNQRAWRDANGVAGLDDGVINFICYGTPLN